MKWAYVLCFSMPQFITRVGKKFLVLILADFSLQFVTEDGSRSEDYTFSNLRSASTLHITSSSNLSL